MDHCIVSGEIACINEHILSTKCGMGKGAMFLLSDVFKKCMMKGIHPHHLVSGMIRDSLV
jgi:hypothetical protein